jgi:putative intracellular protease/amidase
MSRTTALIAAFASHALLTACAGAPPRPPPAGPLDDAEQAATLRALKPPKRARPLVAVLGANAGSETTDYLVPYGVLQQSGVADVVALGTLPGKLTLWPNLAIQPQATVAEFDALHPDGADYVFVPALKDPDDPAAVAFIRAQAAKGATVVGICAGGMTVARAGLLDGRTATTHWYWVDTLRREHPTMKWARDRRYVADRGVVTTTGITASLPVSIAIVEAIAGRERAASLAKELGVRDWSARHDSGAFHLDGGHVWTNASNNLAFWGHQTVGIPVQDGVDEIALGFQANAYSITDRARAVTFSGNGSGQVVTRRGLTLFLDRSAPGQDLAATLAPASAAEPALALDAALTDIRARYGDSTAAWVALIMEYPAARSRN